MTIVEVNRLKDLPMYRGHILILSIIGALGAVGLADDAILSPFYYDSKKRVFEKTMHTL